MLGVERGVPMSPKIRTAILPNLNETEQASVNYVNMLADKVIAYPPPAPKGANEFDRAVMRMVTDQLAFGRISIAEASQKLVDEGNRVLSSEGRFLLSPLAGRGPPDLGSSRGPFFGAQAGNTRLAKAASLQGTRG